MGGNWNNAQNWSPNQIPGHRHTAVLTVAGNYNVSLDISASVTGLNLGRKRRRNHAKFLYASGNLSPSMDRFR